MSVDLSISAQRPVIARVAKRVSRSLRVSLLTAPLLAALTGCATTGGAVAGSVAPAFSLDEIRDEARLLAMFDTRARDTVLVENEWGIREPGAGEIFEPQIVDLVIVPGVCFDEQCHRVGYGKGFYDRFLRKCRPDCVKIGLSFFEPVAEIADIHAGDVRLDFFVSPGGLFAAGE